MIDQADIIVAHNLKKFDLKKANTRFLLNDLDPPRPTKVLDTLTIARSKFGFIGNSLEDLGIQLGIGAKTEKKHGDLWFSCYNGSDMKAWKDMKKYNVQDVILLEKIFTKFLPWVSPYPVVSIDDGTCRKCGSSKSIRRGFEYTAKGRKQRYKCLSCGSWRVDSATCPIE